MSTYRYKLKNFHCQDDCRQMGCPKHEIKITYQTTSDYLTMYKDDAPMLCISRGEANILKSVMDVLQEIGYITPNNEILNGQGE